MTDITPPPPGRTGTDLDPRLIRGLQAVMSAQRPAVLAHIRRIRRRRPAATPDEVIRMLERHYLTAVTASGASVGAASVIPAIGIAASLSLSGVETVAFLEASALFAQSITEIHGIAVEDPQRAQTLVMALMLGGAGQDLVRQFTSQVSTGPVARTEYWGEMVTKSMPRLMMGSLSDRLRKAFIRRFAVTQSGTVIGRAIPFGIGAVIGGAGNNILGRKVVTSARQAFGPAPALWPMSLHAPTVVMRETGDGTITIESLPRRRMWPRRRRPAAIPAADSACIMAAPDAAPAAEDLISDVAPPPEDRPQK